MTGRITYAAPVNLQPASVAGGSNSGGEIFDAAKLSQLYNDDMNSAALALMDAYDARSRAIKAATGIDLGNPTTASEDAIYAAIADVARDSGTMTEWDLEDKTRRGVVEQQRSTYTQKLAELAKQFPQYAGIIKADVPMEEDAKELAKSSSDRLARLMANNPGWGSFAASFAGSGVGSLADPVVLGTLFAGGGAGGARTIGGRILETGFREFAFNAGTTALSQPAVQKWREEVGLEHGFGEAAQNVLFAGVFGAGLGVTFRGAGEGIAAVLRGRDAAVVEKFIAANPKLTDDVKAALRGDPQAAAKILKPVREQLPAEIRGAMDKLDQLDAEAAARPDGVSPHRYDVEQARAQATAWRDVPDAPAGPDEAEIARIVQQLAPAEASITAPPLGGPVKPLLPDERLQGTKVVDAEGQPLTVFHGTPKKIKGDMDMARSGKRSNSETPALWFSSDKDTAKGFRGLDLFRRGEVKEVYLAMQNPRIVDMSGHDLANGHTTKEVILQTTKDDVAMGVQNWDGIIFKNIIDNRHAGDLTRSDVYVVFDPSQVIEAKRGGPSPQGAAPRGSAAHKTDAEYDAHVAELLSGGRAETAAPRPVGRYIAEKMGGIDPRSKVADELRAAGVTVQTSPGLYRRDGLKNLDNLPRDELPASIRHGLADDGNGYASEAAIVEALAEEARGGAAARDGLGESHVAIAEERAHLERQGVDFSASPEQIREQLKAVDDAERRYRAAEPNDEGLSSDEVVMMPPGVTRRAYTEQLVRQVLELQPGLPASTIAKAVNLAMFEHQPIGEALSDVMSDIAGVPRVADEDIAVAAGQRPTIVLRKAADEGRRQASLRFSINGKEVGGIKVTDRNETLWVDSIYLGDNPLAVQSPASARANFNTLGPTIVRQLLRQVRELYPNAKRLAGERAGGARLQGRYDPNEAQLADLDLPSDDIRNPSPYQDLGSEPPPVPEEPALGAAGDEGEDALDLKAEFAALEELGFGDMAVPFEDGFASLEDLEARLKESQWLERVVAACKL